MKILKLIKQNADLSSSLEDIKISSLEVNTNQNPLDIFFSNEPLELYSKVYRTQNFELLTTLVDGINQLKEEGMEIPLLDSDIQNINNLINNYNYSEIQARNLFNNFEIQNPGLLDNYNLDYENISEEELLIEDADILSYRANVQDGEHIYAIKLKVSLDKQEEGTKFDYDTALENGQVEYIANIVHFKNAQIVDTLSFNHHNVPDIKFLTSLEAILQRDNQTLNNLTRNEVLTDFNAQVDKQSKLSQMVKKFYSEGQEPIELIENVRELAENDASQSFVAHKDDVIKSIKAIREQPQNSSKNNNGPSIN